MTPAPALTEATMDKITLDQQTVETLRDHAHFCGSTKVEVSADHVEALCNFYLSALSPPQDVAGFVEELRAHRPDDGNHWKAPNVCTQAADALLSLSARNRGLEGKNGKLREALKPFAIAGRGVPEDESDDELANAMFSNGEIRRAANLQGNGGERE